VRASTWPQTHSRLYRPHRYCHLTLLFSIQYKGTGKVGKRFGPIVLVWFFSMQHLAQYKLPTTREFLQALNPLYAIDSSALSAAPYDAGHGSVMLVVTAVRQCMLTRTLRTHAGQTLVARRCLPALLLNYLGQGAYLLSGAAVHNGKSVLQSRPHGPLPHGHFATFATIIASQASSQARSHSPRSPFRLVCLHASKIKYTNPDHEGQIYLLPSIGSCISAALFLSSFSNQAPICIGIRLAVAGVMSPHRLP